jgi:heme-binding NEAT domain protein
MFSCSFEERTGLLTNAQNESQNVNQSSSSSSSTPPSQEPYTTSSTKKRGRPRKDNIMDNLNRPDFINAKGLLDEVQVMRTETYQLEKIKADIIEQVLDKEKKEFTLKELQSEKKLLLKERKQLLAQLQEIDSDLKDMDDTEKVLVSACESASLDISLALKEKYNPLKRSTDALRAKHGLAPTKTLKDEMEENQAR